jgi:hypothetical protein
VGPKAPTTHAFAGHPFSPSNLFSAFVSRPVSCQAATEVFSTLSLFFLKKKFSRWMAAIRQFPVPGRWTRVFGPPVRMDPREIDFREGYDLAWLSWVRLPERTHLRPFVFNNLMGSFRHLKLLRAARSFGEHKAKQLRCRFAPRSRLRVSERLPAKPLPATCYSRVSPDVDLTVMYNIFVN